MYALFVSLPYVGHVNPLLRQAQALQRRGWRVGVAGMREMARHVAAEAPDIPFVDLGALGDLTLELRRLELTASMDPNYLTGALTIAKGLVWVGPLMLEGLCRHLAQERPNVVVTDIFTAAGACAAERFGIPLVFNNPSLLTGVPVSLLPPAPDVPFTLTARSIHAMRWCDRAIEPLRRILSDWATAATVGRHLNDLRKRAGLPATNLTDLLRGKPILVNGSFGLEYRRALPENIHMVGPMLAQAAPALSPELDRWLTQGPPVVYANLGTVVKPSTSQLSHLAEALRSTRRRALWVLKPDLAPGRCISETESLRVVQWVTSPRAILAHPNVKAFVSHCGINSVYEALDAGTPIAGIPFFADQRDMAVRVADAGVGLWLDKSRFTAKTLAALLDRLVDGDGFAQRIAPLRAAFSEAGGAERAADIIERSASEQPAAGLAAGRRALRSEAGQCV